MSIVWDLYLGVADQLMLESSEEDAFVRAAVSRAFYAAFHRARHYCEIVEGNKRYQTTIRSSAGAEKAKPERGRSTN